MLESGLRSQALHLLPGIPVTASRGNLVPSTPRAVLARCSSWCRGTRCSPPPRPSLPAPKCSASPAFSNDCYISPECLPPSLPTLLRCLLTGTSRPRGCKIAALASANKHLRRGEKKEENQEENIEPKSGHCFCCFKGFVPFHVSLGKVSIITAVDNGEILSIRKKL